MYLTSRCSPELWGPGVSGGSPGTLSGSSLRAIDSSLLWGDEGVFPSLSGQSGLVLLGKELVWTPDGELGPWICNSPEDWPV